MKKLILLPFFLIGSCIFAAETAKSWLGDNVLWRPRENLVFYLKNDSGKEFNLKFTVRDLNTYTYYPSRTLVQVIAPDDTVIVREWLEDDGITGADSGRNFKHQDGIYDPFADYQYRQYHHFNSPGGYPPEKERSPYLANPEKLPVREFKVTVPASSQGIYRVFITSTWDLFISMNTDRKMPTGIHPGTGPLAAVGDTLAQSWFFYPAESADLGIAVTEEIAPYSAIIILKDEEGKLVKSAKASAFCTYLMPEISKKNCAYQLNLEGIKPGLCLTLRGVPQILFPDRETAVEFNAGIIRDGSGKPYFNRSGATLSDWAYSLKPQDLETGITLTEEQKKAPFKKKIPYQYILDAIADQNTDPASPDYGKISGRLSVQEYVVKFDLLLEALTESKDGRNPFHGNPGLLRRIYLAEFHTNASMTPGLRFTHDTPNELRFKRPEEVKTFWDIQTRSNWYSLGLDARYAGRIGDIQPLAVKHLPPQVIEAEKQLYRLWAAGRFNMHAAEVANQWGYNINSLIGVHKLTGGDDLKLEMARQQEMLMTPEYMGRQNPDITPYDKKHGKPDSDVGISNAGYITEHWGFDGEYGSQQETLWSNMCRFFPSKRTVAWFNQIIPLKSHMMVPRYPGASNIFDQFCSPTDYNTRTRGMAHKHGVSADFLGQVDYLDLWKAKKGEKTASVWPALQEGDFVRGFGDKFYFVKQGGLYTILYSGPRQPAWTGWAIPSFHGDSIAFEGMRGMGYGGWGHENKPGLISGIHVGGSGAAWMGTNNSVMDSNTVWGHTKNAIFKVTSPNMEPDVFAACYGPSTVNFDTEKLLYQINEQIPHVPLAVNSELRFESGKIKVKVTISASEDFSAKDMNYSIPYVADRYTPTAVLNGAESPVTGGDTLVTNNFGGSTKEQQDARLLPATFRADCLITKDMPGKGLSMKFDSPQTFRMLSPLRYRAVAPAAGCFVMELPTEWRRNQPYTFTYEISSLANKEN